MLLDVLCPGDKSVPNLWLSRIFPQHCQTPTFTPEEHIQELHAEFNKTIKKLSKGKKARRILNALVKSINNKIEDNIQSVTAEGG